MKRVSFLVLISFLIFFVACNQETKEYTSEKLEKVYEEAGDNRVELEKVIVHYSEKQEDSLKLKAAYFLIENMLEHSYAKAKLVDTTKQIVSFDVLDYENYEQMVAAWDSVEAKIGTIDFVRDTLIYDSQVLTSQYIINNIDLAFEAWQKPWAKKLSFDKFCEYILPYRGSNEPAEDWRSYFLEEYSWLEDSLKDVTDPIEVTKLINTNLKSWFRFDARLYRHPTDLGLKEMLDLKVGRCEDMTNLAIYAIRANGVPVMSDYVTHWPNTGNNHAWNSTYDKEGNVIIFMGAESNPGDYQLNNKKAKVYRKTFSIQDNSLAEVKPDYEEVPAWLAGNHFIDVTSEYISVVDISVGMNGEFTLPDSVNYAYLTVFNSGKWEATAWGKIDFDKKQLDYKNVGTEIAFMPCFYADSLIPANYPFILDSLGQVNFVTSDTSNTFDYSFYSTTKRIIIKTTDEIRKADFKENTEYELFYWDKEWVSLGTQVSEKDKPLEFKNLPKGALFWLKIKDGKDEERIFTINENGEQVWW